MELRKALTDFRATFCDASPGSDEEIKSFLEGFDAAVGVMEKHTPSVDAAALEIMKTLAEWDGCWPNRDIENAASKARGLLK